MKLKNLWLIAVAILIYACNAEETRSWEVTFDPNKPKDPNEQSIINVAAGKFYKMNVGVNSIPKARAIRKKLEICISVSPFSTRAI